MQLLPKWVLPPTMPAIYDLESGTALEMTAKVYGAMNTLIEEYNKFAETVNATLGTFTEDEKEAREKFETDITKVYRQFTCQMNDYLRLNLDDTATKVILEGMNNGTILFPTDTTLKKASAPADAAAVGERTEKLAAEIAVERARITNIAALEEGSTTGDAELQDIRVDRKGNTHENAGTAVRAQTAELAEAVNGMYAKSDAVYIKPSFLSKWRTGSTLSSGELFNNTASIVNETLVALPFGAVVYVDPAYKVGVFSSDGTSAVYETTYSDSTTISRDLQYRIVVYRDDGADISEDEIAGIDDILTISIPKPGQYKLYECGVKHGCVVDGTEYDYPATAVISEYMPVSAGDLVTFYGYTFFAHFYDKDKNYYGHSGGTYGMHRVLTAPVDGYARVQATINLDVEFTDEQVAALSKSAAALNSIHGMVSAAWGNAQISYATLAPTGDNTDMGQTISNALIANGECRLLPGDYYVSGIAMPENAKLYGAGNKTRIIMLDTVTDGAAINCAGGNTIHDLHIMGGMTSKPTTGEQSTTRHGVRVYEATAPVKIDRVTIEGFSGSGVYVYNTGYSLLNSLLLSNSLFRYNRAGIEFDRYAEYATVTGCSARSNYYGVINHGGNNKFSACGFDGNAYGFYAKSYYDADAGAERYPNNGHGSCVGCTFNHNSECAVYMERILFGFLFNGCHFFDGTVNVRWCCGIMFSGCEIGGIPIVFYHAGAHHIFDSVFSAQPEFSLSPDANRTLVTLRDCYTILGEPVNI